MIKSYLEVNLKNVEDNIRKIKNEVGEKVTVAPVIKADAYGLGATKLKNLLEKQNIKIVVVATIDEAIKLRNNGFNMEILLIALEKERKIFSKLNLKSSPNFNTIFLK